MKILDNFVLSGYGMLVFVEDQHRSCTGGRMCVCVCVFKHQKLCDSNEPSKTPNDNDTDDDDSTRIELHGRAVQYHNTTI